MSGPVPDTGNKTVNKTRQALLSWRLHSSRETDENSTALLHSIFDNDESYREK